MNPIKKLVNYIRNNYYFSLLLRRFTEQRPGPLTASNYKGWAMPDPIQARFCKHYRVHDAYSTVYPIKNAVDRISNYLFGYPREELRLETNSQEAREILIGHFQKRGYSHDILDEYYIHRFLANAAASLLLFGRVYFVMVWSDDGKKLVRINRLPSETMKAIRRRGKIRRYRQQYSIFTSNEVIQRASPRVHWNLDEEVRGTTFYFALDEIFFLEWPFDPKRRKGYPPIREAVKHVKQWKSFFKRTTLQMEAMAQPELKDWSHVLALGYDFDKELYRQKVAEIKMMKPFYVLQEIPKTPYYDVWQLKEMLQFIGNIRKFLLDEFNRQVVGAILQRNGLYAQARYVCDYKLTNQEIEELFQRYERGDIGYKEVVDMMLRDKMQPNKSDN